MTRVFSYLWKTQSKEKKKNELLQNLPESRRALEGNMRLIANCTTQVRGNRNHNCKFGKVVMRGYE